MQLIKIKYKSDMYKEEIKLRDEVLRKPLGLKYKVGDLNAEKNELRFGLLDDNGILVACLLIRILDNDTVKLRQMAVKENLRGLGVGKELIEKVEGVLIEMNFGTIELHSRMYARGFYKKLGYSPVGEKFMEIGIPHIKMVKKI